MVSSSNNGKQFEVGNTAAKGHGAPTENINNFKHGLRGRRRFAIGGLPKHCSHVTSQVALMRRELEALVIAAYGVCGPRESLLIQSACRHEQAALLAQRWLRKNAEAMTHADRLNYLTTIAGESDKRDKAIEKLKLDRDTASVIDALYKRSDDT